MDFLNTVNFPNIFRYCKDLSKNTKYNFVERPELTNKIISVLNKKFKNSALLVGDSGVGKSLLVKNLAKNLANGGFSFSLLEKKIFKLDILSLSSGVRQRMEIENRFKELLEEIVQCKQVILFIDEIHTLFQMDGVHLPNILNIFFTDYDFQCICTTNFDEYHKYFENSNHNLANKFEVVKIEQSTIEETEKILNSIKGVYEDYYSISFSEDIIKKCVSLTDKYLINKKFPRKAIDLLDDIGAYIFIKNNNNLTPKMQSFYCQIADSKEKQIENAIALDFKKAIEYRDSVQLYSTQLEFLKERYRKLKKNNKVKVTEDDVVQVISQCSGVPVERILQNGYKNLNNIIKILKQQIFGQDEAIQIVAKSIFKNYCGFSNSNHPVGVFLFLGPTGVGKTELAKLLSQYLLKNDEAFIQINMNEYLERHDIYKLIGSPPGYVGYQDGGFLLKKVKKYNRCLILFDEIEKANKEIHKVLLQIMDSGRTVDVNGKIVDFRNTIIIMTSNIGFNIEDIRKIGFNSDFYKGKTEQNTNNELLKYFSLEFINRIDEIISFRYLDKEAVKTIVDKKLKNLQDSLKNIEYDIKFGKNLKDFLYEKSFSPIYGARYIQRTISKHLEFFLYNKISEDALKKNEKILIDIFNDELFIKSISSEDKH